jgi:hypothetical protein
MALQSLPADQRENQVGDQLPSREELGHSFFAGSRNRRLVAVSTGLIH